MELKIVDFETAKLAKEKGFNIPCQYGYDTLEEGSGLPYENNDSNNYVLASTQHILQKWLRDIHKISLIY